PTARLMAFSLRRCAPIEVANSRDDANQFQRGTATGDTAATRCPFGETISCDPLFASAQRSFFRKSSGGNAISLMAKPSMMKFNTFDHIVWRSEASFGVVAASGLT